ncbi:CRE-PTR-6 protein, partial [Aphelenchoides avenae]
MRCHVPTLDKPLIRFFIWYTKNYLVDYFYVFIVVPIFLTIFCGVGFIWVAELTILDSKLLYTPQSAPCWTEERILGE